MKTSETTKELWKALLKLQDDIPSLLKSAENPHFKSKFVPFEDFVSAMRPALTKHGLVFIQPTCHNEAGALGVLSRLIHTESGEWLEFETYLPIEKQTPQAGGSLLSYTKRYAGFALFFMAGEPDDDGEKATNHAPAKATEPKPPVRKRVGMTPQDGETYDQYEAKPIGVDGARSYLGRWEKMGIDQESIRSTINKHFDGLNTAKLSNAQILSLDAMLIKQQEEERSAVS